MGCLLAGILYIIFIVRNEGKRGRARERLKKRERGGGERETETATERERRKKRAEKGKDRERERERREMLSSEAECKQHKSTILIMFLCVLDSYVYRLGLIYFSTTLLLNRHSIDIPSCQAA